MTTKWTFWIDCGGTFTDFIAVNREGVYRTHKLLSQSVNYESAIVEGIAHIIGHRRFHEAIEQVRLGTTVATNAFLEKKGVKCALVTTLGQRDVLNIRQQNRPRLFDLDIEKIEPLHCYSTEIPGRMNAEGYELTEFDQDIAQFELHRILNKGIKSLAVSFMHSTINPMHELALESLAYKLGFEYVSLSHRVSSVANYISRTETAVFDAYLSPYLKQYTQKLEGLLNIKNILYMQSDGSLCNANRFKGYNALLSGPAGGLIGATHAAKKQGEKKIICFDMGGTSTDVSIYGGEVQINYHPEFHGIKLLTPMMDIHTVAAGGGSILSYDDGRLKVGPESAGAYPGPACYQNGGPLTITDANLFLGRIDPEKFPKVFGPNQNCGLDKKIVREKFNELSKDSGLTALELAEGFIEVAVETMSRAIHKVSVEKGLDPKEFTLVSFGGAGGQMALKVAESLRIESVLIHPLSSVLSAFGIGQAQVGLRLNGRFVDGHNSLKIEMEKKLDSKSFDSTPFFLLRAKDSNHEFQIQAESYYLASEKFKTLYQQTFGIALQGPPVCDTIVLKSHIKEHSHQLEFKSSPESINDEGLISENNTCLVVEKNWSGKRFENGVWQFKFEPKEQVKNIRDERIELEIFYQRFQFIAEQMGLTLKRLARSVNIKERNDFSCALFNEKGELIANAPHIPVHLGSMGDAVRFVISHASKIEPGDSFITNDPTSGGTHLPDVTVITPVFFEEKIVMWLASRGHHADIGGVSPGSMPGHSTCLEQEGVVIKLHKLVHQGNFNEDLLRDILCSGPYPVRKYELNLHDIKAKLAANQKGLEELVTILNKCGTAYVQKMGKSLIEYTHRKIEKALQNFDSSKVKKTITGDRVIELEIFYRDKVLFFNFAGSSPRLQNNFNTPLPVVKASIMFALRCLIMEDIPLNEGVLRSVEIQVPENCMLNPGASDAVVAGNVETSQVICDLVFEALGVKANSQGTMNNLSFGTEKYQYYETLAGGSGATASAVGASAVQVNMTNSLLTDPEVMESRFPVLVELMAIRLGSGGAGQNFGGDGLYRKIVFLEKMSVSMITQFREESPQGLGQGKQATRGINLLESKNEITELSECFSVEVQPGDRLIISTPGGGGFGPDKSLSENLVFCFGSNMDIHQIKNRCPSAKVIKRATAHDYELRYTRYSEARKGGVADMMAAPGHKVWGLLVSITDEDLKTLDHFECSNRGYERIEIDVKGDNGVVQHAYAYDVIDKKPNIAPNKLYEWQVYLGAYNIAAPEYYLDHIKGFR
ncbi:MAG: 5-oxoprolinase [Bacteriovoracaceae bacterium]|jgi:5-oxoprolinase (ATP-hydrolysing)|nr:5-oxoprolinase [Bacteriovoracaceae bacterium]